MVKVLVADNLSPRAVEIFKTRGIETDVKIGLKPDELKAAVNGYDGLAVRSAAKVTADVIAAGKNLKVIGRAGIGVDNIDVNAASARGIVVMNTPYGNAITTAEHTIGLLFSLARQIPLADRSTQAGKWERNKFVGVELTGKTLGVIGAGNIGSIVCERALALKMKVIAYDPYLSPERAAALGVEKVELDELFPRADFVTIHTPLTDQTRGILNAAAFAKMKKGVRIINCARGELIVEADLKAAIESGKVVGAAIDVYPEEPPKNYSLFGMDQVVATPHLGASTTEAQEKVATQIAEQMSDFLLDGAVTNAVNMPSVSAEEAPKLRPYIRLAELLGSLAGQVCEGGIQRVEIAFEGHAAEINTRPIVASALKGLLSVFMENANPVNAPILAKERGIAVTEMKRATPGEYQTLIRLLVCTEQGERTFSGSLFGGDKPRIVEMDGIRLEAELAPRMLFTINEDKPGIIGGIGALFGKAGINIATFHLGRAGPGKKALALCSVDVDIPNEVMEHVRKIPSVMFAKVLRF